MTRFRAAALPLAAFVALPALGQPASGELEPLRLFVESHASALSAKVEVAIGQPDPRLVLAPCNRTEPYLPAGARLWGRSWVGLKCVDGARWSVTVPVEVRVFGPALVATRPLAANQPVSAADVEVREVELSRETVPVYADPRSLEGKLLTRPVAAGNPLRTDHFRAAPVIAQGDAVRVIAMGPGFAVSTDALALNQAGEGQPVRAKTEAGRIITGVARTGRVVEVSVADPGSGR
jgi:flagella basal body P-ring formation protein FlgA